MGSVVVALVLSKVCSQVQNKCIRVQNQYFQHGCIYAGVRGGREQDVAYVSKCKISNSISKVHLCVASSFEESSGKKCAVALRFMIQSEIH